MNSMNQSYTATFSSSSSLSWGTKPLTFSGGLDEHTREWNRLASSNLSHCVQTRSGFVRWGYVVTSWRKSTRSMPLRNAVRWSLHLLMTSSQIRYCSNVVLFWTVIASVWLHPELLTTNSPLGSSRIWSISSPLGSSRIWSISSSVSALSIYTEGKTKFILGKIDQGRALFKAGHQNLAPPWNVPQLYNHHPLDYLSKLNPYSCHTHTHTFIHTYSGSCLMDTPD